MNPKSIISQAPKFYKTPSIFIYETKTIIDKFGYQYLIKGEKKPLKGAVHVIESFESNAFGRFGAKQILLSTMESGVNIGSVIEVRGELFAVVEHKSKNEVLDENDYKCLSLFDYYKDFIIDEGEQINRILGANSLRYILAMNFNIPVFPSLFTPKANKYLSVNIYNSNSRSPSFKNSDLVLEQYKRDFGELYAVGLDTDELQEVIHALSYEAKDFTLCNYPSWEQVNYYDTGFDLKPNIHKTNLEINYKIVGTKKQEAIHLIKKVVWDFNFS